jgi:hypothetical protein
VLTAQVFDNLLKSVREDSIVSLIIIQVAGSIPITFIREDRVIMEVVDISEDAQGQRHFVSFLGLDSKDIPSVEVGTTSPLHIGYDFKKGFLKCFDFALTPNFVGKQKNHADRRHQDYPYGL